MQLAHAMLLDACVEQTALDRWRDGALQEIEEAKTDLLAHFRAAVREAQLGDDVRFRDLTADEVESRTTAEAEAWIRRIADGSPIEVAVVGDMADERAVELTARYLASLPKSKRGFESLDSRRVVDLPEGAQDVSVSVPTVTEKAMVLAGYRGCDWRDVHDRRALSLCARILSDRMRVRLREEQGLVYSIQCTSEPAGTIEGSGLVFAAAPTDPKTADRLADEILAMFGEFAAEGPTAEELKVAAKQADEALAKAIEQPGFWLEAISTLRYRKRGLDELHDLDGLYSRFELEEIHDVAERYFVDDRRIRVIALPQTGD
jgi:zinc protease